MQTHIVLLRGVNVSGSNIIKMAALRESLGTSMFSDVQTYIQSGNIVLKSELKRAEVQQGVYDIILRTFGFEVPSICLSPTNLAATLSDNPFPIDANPSRVIITFFEKEILPEQLEPLEKLRAKSEVIVPGEQKIYFHFPDGSGKSKLSNNTIEKALGTPCTSRNLRTIAKLLEMAN